jgi:hypothetical protein
MSKLREAARGRPCMIRFPEVCNWDETTVVLCHYRLAGECGTGIKPPDVLGAWGCSACHDLVDGRRPLVGEMTRDAIRLAFAEGVMRTLARLIKEGKVK